MKKRKSFKSAVAIIALAAMLLENTYSVTASVTGDIVVNNDISDEAQDSVLPEDITETGSDSLSKESGPANIEIISDTNEAKDADAPEASGEEDILSEDTEESIEALGESIVASGVKELTLYVNTDQMTSSDSFRLDIDTDAEPECDEDLTGVFGKGDGNVFYIRGLKGRKTVFKATDLTPGLRAEYTIRKDGNPQMALISEDTVKAEKKLRVTESGFELKGSGYDDLSLAVDASALKKNAYYNLHINTEADVTYKGNTVKGGVISSLDKNTTTIRLSDLNDKAFTIYIEGENVDNISAAYSVDSINNGAVSVSVSQGSEAVKVEHENDGVEDQAALADDADTTEASVDITAPETGKDSDEAGVSDNEITKETEEAVKRVYEYEDAEVSVIATLQYADAIPDDAEFIVTKITENTPGYNYDAYMQALNDNADRIMGDGGVISDETVLLYDIAFYVADEDGNRVELQPEDGTVRINVQFKKDQLKEDLAAESGEDVKVIHLPLKEDVKDSVNTTAEATDISASDIKVEVVNDSTSVSGESTDFTLSDFSVAAFTSAGKMTPGPDANFRSVLGSASGYGIVANDVTFSGHFESTVAVGTARGNGPMAAPRNAGGNAGKSLIGAYEGGGLLIDNNGNSTDYVIYTTQNAFNNMSDDLKRGRSGVVIDTTTYTESQIKSAVSDMVKAAKATAADLSKVPAYDFSKVVYHDNARDVLDFKSKGSGTGTYYINFAPGEYAKANMLKIILDEGQNVVFNIPDATVGFKQFEITIGNKTWTTNGNSDEDLVCQNVIFNCYNATKTSTVGSVAGTFLVPGSTFSNDAVSAGWVIADKITKVGGTEWHCVWHDMPPAVGCRFDLTAEKTVDWETPNSKQKFWFDLYSYDFSTRKETLIQSVQNSGKSIVFDPIYYNAAGTYSYIVKERELEDPDSKYYKDPTEYCIQVVVELDKAANAYKIKSRAIYKRNGLEAKPGVYDDFKYKCDGTVNFNNQTKQGVPFDFTITKLFYKNDGTDWSAKRLVDKYPAYGGEWPDGASFTFDIERFDGGTTNSGISMDSPIPEKKTITLTKDRRSGSFGQVYFQPDRSNSTRVYMYKITERTPAAKDRIPGVFYTQRPVYIKLFVNTYFDWGERAWKVEVVGRSSYVNDNSIVGQECQPISSSSLEFVNAYYAGTLKVKKEVKEESTCTITHVEDDKDFRVVVYRKGDDGSKIYYDTKGNAYIGFHYETVKGNSEITFNSLPAGWDGMKYYVYEIDENNNEIKSGDTHEYYVLYSGLGSDNGISITPAACKQNATVTNKRHATGKVTVIKKDDTSKEKIDGARFNLKDGDDKLVYVSGSQGAYTYSADKNGTSELTTKGGEFYVDGLPYGTYSIIETASGEGYALGNVVMTFKVGKDGLTNQKISDSSLITFSGVKCSYDAKYTVINRRLKGSLRLIKSDRANASKLSGAEFELYKDGKRYPDTATTYKTDAKGEIYVANLGWGTYYFKEITAPAGYAVPEGSAANTESATINAKNVTQTLEINAYNDKIYAPFRLKKQDSDGKPLAGATFKLYSVDKSNTDNSVKVTGKAGNYSYNEAGSAQVLSTDSNGILNVTGLPYGKYRVYEETAPVGFNVNTTPVTFEITGNGVLVELPFVNTPVKANVEFIKVDGSDKALKGVKFDLYKSINGKFEKVNTLTSGADGHVLVKELGEGSYYFEEQAVTGYEVNKDHYSFEIRKEDNGKTITLPGISKTIDSLAAIVNTPLKGKAELFKYVDRNGEHVALEGAQFALYKDGKKLGGTYTTNEKGIITADNLEWGSYYFLETKAPAGMNPNTDQVKFVISATSLDYTGETGRLELENTPIKGYVQLLKVDEQDSDKKLNGVVFDLYRVYGKGTASQKIEKIGSYSTVNGMISKEMVGALEYGDYYFAETATIDGYELNTVPYEFSIREQDKTIKITATNTRKPGRVTFEKYNSDRTLKLNGAVYELFSTNPKGALQSIAAIFGTEYFSMGTYTTANGGVITVEDLPWGNYYFVEVKAPKGYVADTSTKYSFTIDEAHLEVELTGELGAIETEENGAITLIKNDGEGSELEGAEFVLYKDNAPYPNADMVYTTDSKGRISVSDLPWGTYYFKEIKAPEGFVTPSGSAAETSRVTINETNTFSTVGYNTIEMSNTPIYGSLEVKKVDEKGNELAGAQFSLVKYVDGKEKNIDLTGSNGTYSFDKEAGFLSSRKILDTNGAYLNVTGLPYGKYRLYEEKAPDNYNKVLSAYEFDIDELGVKIEIEFENTPVQADVEFVKADVDNTRLEGAVFRLVKITDEGEIDKGTVTSDQKGKVVKKDLGAGSYYFQEVEAPEGYELNTRKYTFKITAADNGKVVRLDNADTVQNGDDVVINTPKKGSVKLWKAIKGTNTGLEGAVFDLYRKGDKNPIKKGIISDTDGYVRVSDLVWGTYYFKETKAPQGYILEADKEYAFKVDAGNVSEEITVDLKGNELRVDNELIYGQAKLIKQDSVTGSPVEGAVFGLYHANDKTPVKGYERMTTNKKGVIITNDNKDLKAGDYFFKELEPAEGYEPNDEEYHFTINQANMNEVVTAGNDGIVYNTPKKGKVELYKYVKSEDQSEDIDLSGAKFRLYAKTKLFLLFTQNKLVDTYTTDAKGTITIEDLEWGTYYFEEVEAPKGYYFENNDPIEFTISATQLDYTGEYRFTKENKPYKGSVKLVKYGVRGDNKEALQGAAFKFIRVVNGVDTEIPAATEDGLYLTDEKGEIVITDLAWGDYYFEEVSAPEGYALPKDKKSRTLTINASNVEDSIKTPLTAEMENVKIFGNVELLKVDDSTPANPLKDARFALYREDGTRVYVTAAAEEGVYTYSAGKGEEELVTPESGKITVKQLPYGSYYFVETQAPEKFILNDQHLSFKIEKEQEADDDPKIKITFVNSPVKADVEFIKKDAGQPLEGAEFALYKKGAGENGSDAFISNVTSNEFGIVSYRNLGTGNYYFLEVSTLDDAYELLTEPLTFTITREDNGKTVGLENVAGNTVINTPKKGSVKLHKFYTVNNERRGNLGGVTFDLYLKTEGDDELISSYTVPASGLLEVSNLKWGSYYFRETSAPSGYRFDPEKEYPFVIDAKHVNDTINIEIDNPREYGSVELLKLDSIDNRPLEGVVFELKRDNGTGDAEATLATLITDKNGYASKDGLEWGSYVLVEKSTDKEHILDPTPRRFTIDGDNLTKTFTGVDAIPNDRIKGYVELLKKNSATKEPLESIQFDLYSGVEGSGKFMASYFTNAKGKLEDADHNEKIGPLYYGAYYFKEITPEGFEPNNEDLSFFIERDGQLVSFTDKRTVYNTPKEGSVILRKVDEEGRPLAGAEFTLFTKTPKTLGQTLSSLFSDSYEYGKYTTDRDGYIRISGLAWDSYFFVETKAPKGHEIIEPGKRYEFVIGADNVTKTLEIGPVVNRRLKGTLELIKEDEETREKLAGAKFKLFKVGDGEDTDVSALYGATAGEFMTSAEGIITVSDVEWGSYYFLETRAPEGYEAISETNVVKSDVLTIDAGNQDDSTLIMQPQKTTVTNKKGYGYVSLKKVFDGEQPESLAGVEFALINDTNNKELGTYKTDENGMITADVIGRLGYGDYHFEEVGVPAGISYSISAFKPSFSITESNPLEAPIEFTFVNSEILASAKVIKIDPFSKDRIANIRFNVYNADGDKFVTTITSDAEGVVEVNHLPMGSYYFKEDKESAAAAGYVAGDDTYTFTITAEDRVAKGEPEKYVTVYKNGTEVVADEVPNPKAEGSIRLVKTGTNLANVKSYLNVSDGEFELYKDGALYKSAEELKAYVTGKEIVVTKLPWGSYYFKEVKAPEGYVLPEGDAANTNSVVLDATNVSDSLTTPLTCQIDDKTIKVYISKREVGGSEELPGAELELYEADEKGTVAEGAAPIASWTSGNAPKFFETGADGAMIVSGKTYLIKETKSPDGFGVADDIVFSVNPDGSVKTSARVSGSGNGMIIIMEDAPINAMISKKEMGTDVELSGATLRIMDGTEPVESWITTGKPHVINGKLTVGKTYVLEETNPPKGYYTAEPISFIVKGDGKIQVTGNASASAEVSKADRASELTSTLTMYDRPIRVEISKKRLSGSEDDFVAGAELALYEKNGNEYNQIFSWISPASGPVLIEYGLLKVGNLYKVVETKAPAGFVKSADIFFTVKDYNEFEKTDANGMVTQQETVYDESVKAVFSKKSVTGDDELVGATLQLLDEEGNVITEFVSSDKETLVTPVASVEGLSAEEKAAYAKYNVIYGIKLIPGKTYSLHEVSAPYGYAMAEDVVFTIDENGNQKPSPVVMRDKPIEIKLSKKDIGTGKYLAGAELELYNAADEKVAAWTSSEKPVLLSVRNVGEEEAAQYAEVIPVKLPAGTYTLKEVKAPEGYKVADPLTLVISGADVKKDNGEIREESMYDYKEGSTSLIGHKEWVVPRDGEGNIEADFKYPDIKIKLYRDSVEQGKMDEEPCRTIVLENGTTSFAFGDLERYKTSNGQNYEYTYDVFEEMYEKDDPKYTKTKLEIKKDGDQNTVVFMSGFLNVLNQEYVDLKGVKTFTLLKDKNGKILNDVKYDNITIWLLQNGKRVDIDGDGKEESVAITGGAKDTNGVAQFTFSQLPKYDLTTGNAYKYTVEETGSDNYIYSITYNNDEVRITNTPKAVPFEIKGVKTWVDPDGAKRPDVTIQLYRDGKLYRETKLNADNTFSFSGLYEYNLGFGNEEGDMASTADGHKFFYEVKEAGALGYDVKISGSGDKLEVKDGVASVSITNTIKQEYVQITGNKFWNDRGDSSKRPSVTINLYATDSTGRKDELVDTYVIKNTSSRYEFGTPGRKQLPKYDANGKEISYRVAEEELAGYISEVKGNDITNTPSKIVISKLDATEHTELPGAVLSIIRKRDNKEVDRWTSGSTPHYIEALEIGEVYILKEITAPAGYALAKPVEFQVGVNGVVQKVEMFDDPIIGSVTLTKYDATNREKLAGAEFALYTKDGKEVAVNGTTGSYTYSKTGSGTKTLVVNGSGELKVDKMPYGTYYFKETKAPNGYELKSETIGFSITDHGVNVTVSFEDPRLLGSASLLKTDEDGNALAGAEFELYSKTPTTTGQAAASTVFSDAYYRYGTYTTDSEGRIKVENLPWDDYYFIETKAPEGYQTNRDVSGDPLVYTFTINADNAGSSVVNVATVTNEKIDTGVLGERVPPAEKVSGVLGVRSKPKAGVLGTRVGPATGDASAIALWITLLVACIGTIVWMIASRKKKGLEN